MAFASLMLLCLTGTTAINHLQASSTDNLEYSGEELVRGILLADGVVASRIPELADFSLASFTSDPEMQRNLSDFHNRVMSQIGKDNPNFFAAFKTKIYSHNHATIRAAISDGKVVVQDAIAKVNKNAKTSMDQETQSLGEAISDKMQGAGSVEEASVIARNYLDTQSGGSKAAVGSWICVAHATVAVAVSVAVAFYTEYYFWPEELSNAPANNRIFQESIINSIATRL